MAKCSYVYISSPRPTAFARLPRVFAAVYAALGLAACGALFCCNAAVTLAGIFQNDMVMQRNMQVPVWGRASAGENITVTFGGQTKTTAASADGSWSVKLDPLAASATGRPMSVKGTNTIVVNNVVVGEVWLCAGQSNMALRPGWGTTDYYLDSLGNANYPLFRQTEVESAPPWIVCNPQNVWDFSTVGYFFGRDLLLSLGQQVPVGLILTAYGATMIEQWMKNSGGDRYDCCVKPVEGYAMRGIAWYQGENNTNNGSEYAALLVSFIREWRANWKQDSLAFLIVQLPNYDQLQTIPVEQDNGIMEVREGQMLSVAQPHTGLAITIDMTDANPADLHPLEKWVAGSRLALWAEHMVYGKQGFVYSGPLFRSMSVRGSRAYLRFYHAGAGLRAEGATLNGFAVCGPDSHFVWATARAMGDSVEAYSSQVAQPVAVRYGWASNPVGNLYNSAGLPASPFRTDGPRLPEGLFEDSIRTSVAHQCQPSSLRLPPVLPCMRRGIRGDWWEVSAPAASMITVSTANGQCVLQTRTNQNGTCTIAASALRPGVHFIRCRHADGHADDGVRAVIMDLR